MKKKKYCIVLWLLCIFLIKNTMVFAAQTDTQESDTDTVAEGVSRAAAKTSGKLGNNGGFTWKYNTKTATLTISGSDTGLNGSKTKSSPIKALDVGVIEKVVFKNCKFRGSLSYLLDFCTSVKKVEFKNCDTSKVTSMYRMFFCCSGLTSLDLSSFNTSKVKNMSGMFAGCDRLTSLDLSSFNTSNVTNMAYMFNCRKLKTLKVSGFKTSNVTNMEEMFSGCSSLTSLNLKKWDMSKVKKADSFLYGCKSLKTLYMPKKINKSLSIQLPAKFSDETGKKHSKLNYKYTKQFFCRNCTYSIQFVKNGASSGTMKTMKKCKYGTSYKLTKNTYKRKGYTFVGWNTKADGSGTSYKNKAKIRNLTQTDGKTITLYAQWTKKTYTVTYELNGGKNNKNNPSSYTITTSTKKLKNPTRSGYVFQGWYQDAKCTKKVTQIKKGSSGNLKLYAKWEKKK